MTKIKNKDTKFVIGISYLIFIITIMLVLFGGYGVISKQNEDVLLYFTLVGYFGFMIGYLIARYLEEIRKLKRK